MATLNVTVNKRPWSLYVLRIRAGILPEPFGLCSMTVSGSPDPHYLRFASDPTISDNTVELPTWLFNYMNCPSMVDIQAVKESGMVALASDI
ncbi:hypothetical protein PSACC_00920 [Paramicrosporidium saccamoebae]|uniref:Uncharacterized protein n=1 Tax=Paramicrosporidium saccamoebae TaxID=1246581 RepID=A0A2H9TNE7_9FUNG|nr:hypothetical protein PSACC_00920 [Paramicrosporidium saccamoebae]